MPLLHPSGGMVYHGRALRSARTRWAGFRESIGHWLSSWEPASDGLILVGPSGGYSLPSDWLARFPEVVAVDFDPLARHVFRRRHRACALARWIDVDVLPTGPQGIDWKPLRRLLSRYPDHAVLFSNVLGQVALSTSHEELVERDLASLPQELAGRHWASYHDRLSAPQRPKLPKDRRHRTDRELADLAFTSSIEVSSHSTERLAGAFECETFAWECEPGYWHLIEGCVGKADPTIR